MDSTQYSSNIDTLMTANAELNAKMAQMQLHFEHEAANFKAAMEQKFAVTHAAALAHAEQLTAELDAAREQLRNLQSAHSAEPEPDIDMAEASQTGKSVPKAANRRQEPPPPRTRDPRLRPTASPPTSQFSPSPGPDVRTKARDTHSSPNAKEARPPPRRSSRSSVGSKGSQSSSQSPPTPSCATPTKPKGLQSQQSPPASSPATPKPKLSKDTASPAQSPQTRRKSEYQVLAGETAPNAVKTKTAFQYHLCFLIGALESSKAPASASPDAVAEFNTRFKEFTVGQLRRMGQSGPNLIALEEVDVGLRATAVHSRNKIISAFRKLEESALFHVRAYLAKLGINVWAPDFNQTPYSLYNMAMRMSAIDTFRFLVAATHYDFLEPNTQLVRDPSVLPKMYDHFVHHYLFEQWKLETRQPGGTVMAADRNKAVVNRSRLFQTREAYLEDTGVPKRLRRMFSLKATSDDEKIPNTTNGFEVLARPERSQDAELLVRALEGLIIRDLDESGKRAAATKRRARTAAPLSQRKPSQFAEVPKGMPLQYYDADWFNERPSHLRAKLEPDLRVVFAPGTSDFFSRRGDNGLGSTALNDKYGAKVRAAYDLDFLTKKAAASDSDGETSGGETETDGEASDDETSGESRDSDDVDSVSSSIAVDDDFVDDSEQDVDANDAAEGEGEAEADERNRAAFAAAYGMPMDEDLERENLTRDIFGGSGEDDDDV